MADTIGTILGKLRTQHITERGKPETQQELANAIGVSRKLVDAWENNDRLLSKTEHLIKLADHFGVSCDRILGRIGEDNSTNNEKLRMVTEYTGLSNGAIEAVRTRFKEDHLQLLLSQALEREEFSYLFLQVWSLNKASLFLHLALEVFKRIKAGESYDDAIKSVTDSPLNFGTNIAAYNLLFAEKTAALASADFPKDDVARRAAYLVAKDAFDRFRLGILENNDAWNDFMEAAVATKKTLKIARKELEAETDFICDASTASEGIKRDAE